jgi:hypothetical protein
MFPNFWSKKPWIRIGSGPVPVQPKLLDTDPKSINPNPKIYEQITVPVSYLLHTALPPSAGNRYRIRGASKIKLKKVNKTRTVTVRRVIIFLNISRCSLLICLHCCLHQYKGGDNFADPCQGFLGVSSGLPLV